MKVYIVIEGEYSDWMLVGAFSTREKAERYVAKELSSISGHYYIDEQEVDAREYIGDAPKLYYKYHGEMYQGRLVTYKYPKLVTHDGEKVEIDGRMIDYYSEKERTQDQLEKIMYDAFKERECQQKIQ